jgi:choline dehydrogenase
MADSYDYIVVGAGSAGCIVAARLAAESSAKVLLLEAGPSDDSYFISMPLGYGLTFYSSRLNWRFMSEPVPGLNNRRLYTPRGKVLGGSSSINAMVYIRGTRNDFADWQAAGNPGWGFEDVVPAYEKIEAALRISSMAGGGHPLCNEFFKAGTALGLARNDEPNGKSQEGIGWYPVNIHGGKRRSASAVFLRPALTRPNLRVVTDAQVKRILFDGRKAIGVEYGAGKRALANAEVILSAGAFGSPQLLQVSGIGDPVHLQSIGVDVVQQSSGVGHNLQDHLAYDHLYRSRAPTLNEQLRPLHRRALVALEYFLFRKGPLAWSMNHAGGFVPSRQNAIQLYFCPSSYDKTPPGKRVMTKPDPFPGFSITACNTRPASRGTVLASSSDASAAPLIQPNLMTSDEDAAHMLEGAKLMRRFAAKLSSVVESETKPGTAVESDGALLEDIRNHGYAIFHPCGTCRMASDGVVDHELRVRGVGNLRVIDASVFPNIISGNINAPSMMVGWKGADLLLRK